MTKEGQTIRLTSANKDPTWANYEAAGHVEGKAAIGIRENDSAGGILYHNNPGGICGYCVSQVETLLPQGAKLTVVSPANAVPKTSRHVVGTKTFTGNSNTPKPVKVE